MGRERERVSALTLYCRGAVFVKGGDGGSNTTEVGDVKARDGEEKLRQLDRT